VLTFVATVYLGLADERWTVNFVAAEENIIGVGIASAHVAASATLAPSIVTFVLGIVVSTKNAIELYQVIFG
jgi:hypothetical protein